jgi:flagellar basal body-associated protein FliL
MQHEEAAERQRYTLMSYDPNQPANGQPQPPSPYAPPPQYGQQPTYDSQAPMYGPQPQFYPQPTPKKSRRWLWITLAIILVVLIGGATAIVLTVNNSPAKTVVQQYYNAVEKQDYSTAYSYLAGHTLTLNGQQQNASQGLYTQVAQTIDQENGKVTAYNITGIYLNFSTSTGNTATITVNVTRGSTTQEVHVQLQQEGNDWKIVNIDQL